MEKIAAYLKISPPPVPDNEGGESDEDNPEEVGEHVVAHGL